MRQGDVCWLPLHGVGSEPRGRRPVLVVQHDRFNRSAISTAIVAAVTANARLADMPGNVALPAGEANLPQASVVNVSQLRTVDRRRLEDRVGRVSPDHMREVLSGLALVLGTDDVASP